MPLDFQMKDKDGNLIYDSDNYVYRSEDKEPQNIENEIAFEINTDDFTKMGFDGIISWIQEIAEDQNIFEQMIIALKKEKNIAIEDIQNAQNDMIFSKVKRIIELDIWAEAIMVALRSANRDRLGDWWMFNDMDFYYQCKKDYFSQGGLDEMYIISQVQSWKEKAKDHIDEIRKDWTSVMDRNLLIRHLDDIDYEPSVDERLRMRTDLFAKNRDEWINIALDKKNFFNTIKHYIVKSTLTEKLFSEEINIFYGKQLHKSLIIMLWTNLEREFAHKDGMFHNIEALSRGKFKLDKNTDTGELSMRIDYRRKF
ncbi:MAG: hypothetical protein ACJZ1O_06845 [Candidatus Neomarinimicrobiota bacterium]|tara:strand:+ start:190 stop:1122 length:933 start_codon:yes stop_codon:yes gene_type:complete